MLLKITLYKINRFLFNIQYNILRVRTSVLIKITFVKMNLCIIGANCVDKIFWVLIFWEKKSIKSDSFFKVMCYK